jgi:hypothetical protein
VKFNLKNTTSFIPGLNVYCGPLFKSLLCASHNAGREMVCNIDPVYEYEARSAKVPRQHNNTKRI